jgi:hypothetical protein
MNGDLSSQSAVLARLHVALLIDICNLTGYSRIEAHRDNITVEQRLHNEGLSFMTKTLPLLGKAVDSALLTGRFIAPSQFKLKRGERLPAIYNGLLKMVFHRDGALREDVDVDALRSLRQVAYTFYKYELPYDASTRESFVDDFVTTDGSVGYDMTVDRMSAIFYGQSVIEDVLKEFSYDDICLKNGPGATACKTAPWKRYRPHVFYEELDELYPYAESYYYNDKHLFDEWEALSALPVETGGTSRMMLVPKDSRGPRVISAEPHEKMAYQQALRIQLYDFLESSPITGGQVNFTDQSINGSLALKSSTDGKLATLDLRKASDLLSLDLVYDLFCEQPICDWLLKSRSSHIETPVGSLKLKKFAPMGNALTFPVQALSFYALITGRMIALGVPRRQAYKSVYVYGDDIIVPCEWVSETIDVLTLMGLQINTDKSCFTGEFRESCGVDAYKGENVTPLKIKKLFTCDKNDVTSLAAWVSYANNLYKTGYWYASSEIQQMIERVHGALPRVSDDSPLIGFAMSFHNDVREANQGKLRYDKKLQRWTIRGLKALSRTKEKLCHGWERLTRFAWDASPSRLEAFSTGTFTERRTVVKKYVVEGVDFV